MALSIEFIMTTLNILCFPDPRLTRYAKPVTEVNAKMQSFLDDMLETMYAAPGIGLAAPQVSVLLRVIVIDVSEEKNQPLCFINPEIIASAGEVQTDEGCLSVPGFYETVTRSACVRVRALDRAGKSFELEADGLLAVCIQHEIDHLEGKLFVDYISALKRSRIRKKLLKQAHQMP